jgi:N-acyl-D-aspartate/D-glutamate deacylase
MGCDISTSEEAVETYLRLPYVAICTDGFHQGWLSQCHPRTYGTFPRVLGTYVRERGTLSLSSALRKMTAVPAIRMGLADRGVLRRGARADLVILDPETVADNATFVRPAAPTGIELVMVNGVVVVDGGAFTGDSVPAPGHVLRGPACRSAAA